MDTHMQNEDLAFSDSDLDAVYRAIFTRRDTRGQFLPDPVSDEVLSRILMAAHHAPSVGFMQPWSFMVIRKQATKQKVHDLFDAAHVEAAEMFDEEKRDTYKSLKLEGIMESPVNVCITCDRNRAGPVVIGRTHVKAMDLYSTVCAVQNLWLAARAEGLGVGWVSIYNQPKLQDALGMPRKIVPIAYLCIGHVTHLHDKPELETAGWRPRLPIEDLMHFEHWDGQPNDSDKPLLESLRQDQDSAQKGDIPGR
ncbi:MAG: 5,6-dimethylbenzimidazole synthase [Rhodospirillales bacterium]|jgi:5,6-dimethylbenzimidazole synthase|nr:5,6-dimethylbenzimidazole synthase [Rhodospirillales bacterium]